MPKCRRMKPPGVPHDLLFVARMPRAIRRDRRRLGQTNGRSLSAVQLWCLFAPAIGVISRMGHTRDFSCRSPISRHCDYQEIVTKDITLVARIAVEDLEARTPYSSANMVVTGEGSAASKIAPRASTRSTRQADCGQHCNGMHKLLKQNVDYYTTAASNRIFSSEMMSTVTKTESRDVASPIKSNDLILPGVSGH
jgi:hypothetical protein